MATEDALTAHFMKNVARHETRIANACSDQCTRRLAETAARLTHSEHEVVDLLKAKTALETKCHRLEKLWETERKGRDVLDHARAQKEKHVCVLLKERDRLEREVKALRRKGETPTPRKMAAPVTPTDLPSPVKMAALSPPRPPREAYVTLWWGDTTARAFDGLVTMVHSLRRFDARRELRGELRRGRRRERDDGPVAPQGPPGRAHGPALRPAAQVGLPPLTGRAPRPVGAAAP